MNDLVRNGLARLRIGADGRHDDRSPLIVQPHIAVVAWSERIDAPRLLLKPELAQLRADNSDFRLRNGILNRRHDSDNLAAAILAEVRERIALRSLLLGKRPHPEPHDASRRRVESARVQLRLDAGAHPPKLGEVRLCEELPDRRKRDMRPARDCHSGRRVRLQQHGQDRLRDKRHAAGRPDVEAVLAPFDLAGNELQLARAHLDVGHLRAAYLGDGLHAREVLALQSRLLAPRANLLDPHRPPRDRAQRQRSAQHLPAALALRSVNLYEVVHVLLWFCPAPYIARPMPAAMTPQNARDDRDHYIVRYLL